MTAYRTPRGDRPERGRGSREQVTRFRAAHQAIHEAPADGRAEAAYKEEFGKWEGLIDAAANDLGLSRDQRTAAVIALRARQQIAAKGARQRAIEEERQNARARRRQKQCEPL